MANPQIGDGYIKISNELFRAICKIRIPGEARQIFDSIMSQTYGFNRKEARISTKTFIDMTGLSRSAVQKARNKLIAMNLIIISVSKKGYTKGLIYCIQKDYDKWKVYPKRYTPSKVYPKKDTECIQKGIHSVSKKVYTSAPSALSDMAAQGPKDNIKDNIKDNRRSTVFKIDFDFEKKAFINIQKSDKERWKKAYPAIDIETEILAAAEWLIANPNNRKSNYPRYLTNWFKRSQDKAPKKHKQKETMIERYKREKGITDGST